MYQVYKENSIAKIKECIKSMETQPILFVGSGFSKRYFNAPNWEELLKELCKSCSEAKPFSYYKQTYDTNINIGTQIAEVYKEWAWGEGKSKFSEELFNENYHSDIFIKSKICEYFDELTPKEIDKIHNLKEEIEVIQSICPYAIITTNYDRFIELIFPEYTPVIGQQILKSQFTSIGEIFKIHGCISEPESLVFTKNDYSDFMAKKKYLSAKLLTFFLEHPILLIGYGAGDPNIQAILSDIDEILISNNNLTPNIFILDYVAELDESNTYPYEKLVRLENEKSIRINSIATNDFGWVYSSFINENAIDRVNPKLLRALMSRTYELIRSDIPKRIIEIDYQTLEHALSNEGDINKIFGITNVCDSTGVNISFPYTLTEVAEKIGYATWHHANELLNRIANETGVNIKGSDNNYHVAIRTGGSSLSRKYSEKCVELLEKVMNCEEYTLDL